MGRAKERFIVQMQQEKGMDCTGGWADVMADPQGDAPMVFVCTAQGVAFIRAVGVADAHYRVVSVRTPVLTVEIEQTERRTIKELEADDA